MVKKTKRKQTDLRLKNSAAIYNKYITIFRPVTTIAPPKAPPPSERQNPNPLKEAPPLKSALSYDDDDFDEDDDDDEDEDEGPYKRRDD